MGANFFMQHPFKSLFASGVAVWICWVFLAGSPLEKADRICQPIEWGGRLVGNALGLASGGLEAGSNAFFGRAKIMCKYIVFRQLYDQDLRKLEIELSSSKSGQ